jgi:hypothetical protein
MESRNPGPEPSTPTATVHPTPLDRPDDSVVTVVEFADGDRHRAQYLHRPFRSEPDFRVTSVNYDLAELLAPAEVRRWR